MNFVIIPALIGPLLGPTVGGLIVHWLRWRDIFFVNVPVGVVALWLGSPAHAGLSRRRLQAARRVRPAAVRFGRGVAVLAARDFRRARIDLACRGRGVSAHVSAAARAYAWHAQRTRFPLLNLSLFRTRTYRVSVLGGFVTRLGVGGMPLLLPLLFQLGLGLPAWQSGLLMMPMPWPRWA